MEATKHTPHRWMTLSKAIKCIIRCWHPFRQLYVDNGDAFPLDMRHQEIREIFSLLEPCAALMRDGQSASEPMSGKLHSLLGALLVKTLNPKADLKVTLTRFGAVCLVGPQTGEGGDLNSRLQSVAVVKRMHL